MAVNIYDVAKLSGVSIATVSRVVNGSTKVSEKTRRKVLDVMEQCGYTPNCVCKGTWTGFYEDHRNFVPGYIGCIYCTGSGIP